MVYTDREANLRMEDDVMKFYKWTLLRMYNSDMRIEHCDRENASHKLVNDAARFARTLPHNGIRLFYGSFLSDLSNSSGKICVAIRRVCHNRRGAIHAFWPCYNDQKGKLVGWDQKIRSISNAILPFKI